ncbi:MAG: metallophosphoesterase family protein [Gemmatimonadales bacterium]
MKVLIIADVHGNLEALKAVLADPHDALICLGDMVGYGPEPGACVRRILDEDGLVMRGNHDHALATGAAPGCPPSFQWLAEATMQLGAAQLSTAERSALAELPLRASQTIDGMGYHLVHAAPTDPMYRYLVPTSDGWEREVQEIGPEVLLVGHSHLQFRHHVAGRTIISPGSVGQPRHGDARAAYMVIEDGTFSFCRVAYRVERTVAALERSGIEPAAAAVLTQLLRSGHPSLFLTPTGPAEIRSEARDPRIRVTRSPQRRLRAM